MEETRINQERTLLSADALNLYSLPVSDHLTIEHADRWLEIYGTDWGEILFGRKVRKKGTDRLYVITSTGLLFVVVIATSGEFEGQEIICTAFHPSAERYAKEAEAAGVAVDPEIAEICRTKHKAENDALKQREEAARMAA